MKHFISHGDVNLHPITKEEYEKLAETAELQKHNGSWVLAYGETTGHRHIITAEPDTLEVRKLTDGRGMIFKVGVPSPLTHEEHGKLDVEEDYYIQIAERELNHFVDSVERKVID